MVTTTAPTMRRTRYRKPSPRMRRLATILAEDTYKPMGAAMREAGYSEAQSHNPKQVFQSKSWQEIMEEVAPDVKIALSLRDLMDAKVPTLQEHRFPPECNHKEIRRLIESVAEFHLVDIRDIRTSNGSNEPTISGRIAYYVAPDHRTRQKVLDMIFRLKGHYNAVKEPPNSDFNLLKLREGVEKWEAEAREMA